MTSLHLTDGSIWQGHTVDPLRDRGAKALKLSDPQLILMEFPRYGHCRGVALKLDYVIVECSFTSEWDRIQHVDVAIYFNIYTTTINDFDSTVYNYNKYIKRSFIENSTFLTFSFFHGGWKNTKSVSGKIVLR